MTKTARAFDVKYPSGQPGGHDVVDFAALQAAGAFAVRLLAGDRVHLTFKAPFETLTITEGERLTLEKLATLRAVMAHFNVTMERIS